MLGQKELQEELLASTHKTIILSGESGSGKTTLVKQIAKEQSKTYYEIEEARVGHVREVVEHSNSTPTETIYYFRNSDKMTNQAQNALLKVAEEPPTNASIVIGTTNPNNLLATIKSRSVTYQMAPYTQDTLQAIAEQVTSDGMEVPQWVIEVSTTPGELIKYANEQDSMEALLNTAKVVVEQIGKATLQNVLTISDQVPKGTEVQFTYFLLHHFRKNLLNVNLTYLNESISAILEARNEMNNTNANKKNVLDMMLHEIWRLYRTWNLPS